MKMDRKIIISLTVLITLCLMPATTHASIMNESNATYPNVRINYSYINEELYDTQQQLSIVQNDYFTDLKSTEINQQDLKINKHNLKWVRKIIKKYKHKKHHINKYLKKNKKNLIKNIKQNKKNYKYLQRLLNYESSQLVNLNQERQNELSQQYMYNVQTNPFTYDYNNQYNNTNNYSNSNSSNINNYQHPNYYRNYYRPRTIYHKSHRSQPIKYYNHVHNIYRHKIIRRHLIK